MDIPPPMPTVLDAIKAVDRAMERVTIPAVRAKLRELRGFDASPSEVARVLEDWRVYVRAQSLRVAIIAMGEIHDFFGGPSGQAMHEMGKIFKRTKLSEEADGNPALDRILDVITAGMNTEAGRVGALVLAQAMLDGGTSPEDVLQRLNNANLPVPDIVLERMRGSKDADNAGTG